MSGVVRCTGTHRLSLCPLPPPPDTNPRHGSLLSPLSLLSTVEIGATVEVNLSDAPGMKRPKRLRQLSNPDTPRPQRTRATLDMLDMDIFSRSADMSMSTCIF